MAEIPFLSCPAIDLLALSHRGRGQTASPQGCDEPEEIEYYRKPMRIDRSGSNCLKVSLILYTLLFWASGFALIFLGFYVIFEPKRSYVLDFVDFSEDDPLLTFAAYTSIVAGISTLLVGFIGFFGALNRMKCLLVGFMLCLIGLFLADVAIGTLALAYKGKFSDDRMVVYLANLTNNRYSRDKWVKPLLDTLQFYIHRPNATVYESLRRTVKFEYGVSMEIERNRKVTNMINRLQFYEECCGAISADDYLGSTWMATLTGGAVYEDMDPPLVPESCCRQIAGASALNPVARSLARCQQPDADRKWRHTTQKCCGGAGPYDYYNSFWYITNTERGTRSFVPQSCCKQAQAGRAWAVVPVDPMCTTYFYYTQAFNTSVNTDGCHEKMLKWFDEQTIIFAAVGFSFAGLMMIGLILSLCFCTTIRYRLLDQSY